LLSQSKATPHIHVGVGGVGVGDSLGVGEGLGDSVGVGEGLGEGLGVDVGVAQGGSLHEAFSQLEVERPQGQSCVLDWPSGSLYVAKTRHFPFEVYVPSGILASKRLAGTP
jgi:hypothetical protein